MKTKRVPDEVTKLLQAWADGDVTAGDRLLPIIYDELHRMADQVPLAPGGPIAGGAGEWIDEVYHRLTNRDYPETSDRSHFHGLAAPILRRVVVDCARSRLARRVDGASGDPGDETSAPAWMTDAQAEHLVRLDDALDELSADAPRRAQIVELRYFGGMRVNDTARVMQVSPSTVKRDWAAARDRLRTREGGPIEFPFEEREAEAVR